VLQSEFIVGFLVTVEGKSEFIYTEIPCTLHVGDRSTAEVLRCQIQRIMDLPLMQTIRALFKTIFDLTTADLGSNNVRCENSFRRDFVAATRMSGMCVAHRYSTIQGCTFKILHACVSGTIAYTMTQKASGNFEKLQKSLRDALLARVLVFIGLPAPGEASDESRAQQALLTFIGKLSTRPYRKKQLLLLAHFFKGSPQSDQVALYLPVGLSADAQQAIVAKWADDAAEALLPYAIPLFARHRWCTSSDTFAGLGLLALQNNLLPEATSRWMVMMGHKAQIPSQWEDGDNLDLALVADPSGQMNETYWTAFNERNRRDALSFGLDPSTPTHLVLLMGSMEPLIQSFHQVLHLGSCEYEAKELKRAAVGGDRSYPILEMVSSRLVRAYYQKARVVCFNPGDHWAVLPESSRTERSTSIAFSLNMRSVAGIEVTVNWVYLAYPFRLWILVDQETDLEAALDAIMGDCKETWDDFTMKFRALFPTRDTLASGECRLILISIAIIFRIHMARIENRHAFIGRMLRDRGSTWLCELLSICSDWVLATSRRLEKEGWQNRVRKSRRQSEPAPRTRAAVDSSFASAAPAKPKHATVRGGRQRAFASQWLRRNKRLPGESRADHFKRLSDAYRSAPQPVLDRMLEIGRLATMSARSGGSSFGLSKRQFITIAVRRAGVAVPPPMGLDSSTLAVVSAFQGDVRIEAILAELKVRRIEEVKKTKAELEERETIVAEWSCQRWGPTSAPNDAHGPSYSEYLPQASYCRFPFPIPNRFDLRGCQWLPANAKLGQMVPLICVVCISPRAPRKCKKQFKCF
jgi:hypothetical protein